jgi:D-arabinose 5-phosphate isomerase GutQ
MYSDSSKKEKFNIKRFAEPIVKYHVPWFQRCYEEIIAQSEAIERAGEVILPRENIFLAAEGRSRDVLYFAGKRFLGLGYHVYGIDEHFIVSMKNNNSDVLIGMSGTGTSKPVVSVGKVAKDLGVPFILVTSYENSEAAQLADLNIIIKGRTKDSHERDYESRQLMGEHTEIASALGTEFEIKVLGYFECLSNYLGHKKGKTERDLADRHPNF